MTDAGITDTKPTCVTVRASAAFTGRQGLRSVHLPYNRSATEDYVALIARTDPNEQESVVLLPELDSIHPEAV